MSAVERVRAFLADRASMGVDPGLPLATVRRSFDERNDLTVADLRDLVEKAALVDTIDAAIDAVEKGPEPESEIRWEYAVQRPADGGIVVPLAITSEEKIRQHARRWEPSAAVVRRTALTTYGPWEPAP